jgi:hypothetical protein
LKEDSENLDIVTRYDMQADSQGRMLGGQVIYPGPTASQKLSALFSFDVADGYYEYASVSVRFGFVPAVGVVAVNSLECTIPLVIILPCSHAPLSNRNLRILCVSPILRISP